jgi:molybdopterin/thiamine biosynthesis adenylyltransferase
MAGLMMRYSRQITLPGVGSAGQQTLADATVLVVGAGGLGSPVLLYLGAAGIGRLIISDFDRVDESNLARQILYDQTDIDNNKAQAAAAKLAAMNPDTTVDALTEKLDADALLRNCNTADVVLDCTDNFASRWNINAACAQTKTPLVSGAAIRFEGQLAVFRHDQSASPCYRCLYSEADESLEDCAGQGILGPVAGTVGSMMATEALKLVLGLGSDLEGVLWVYDGRRGTSHQLKITPLSDCPVCATSR